jgi:predicted dehydrogenase
MIGQGFMGRAHSNAFLQVGRFFDLDFRLRRRVVCGRDPARLAEMAERWEWEETATDWRDVVERSDIDIVDVATPNALHAPIAIAAAGAGKIVLCEKPMAMSVDEGARMVEAVRRVPNMVWFNYRRVPAVAFARRLIDEGRIGRVFHYRATYLQQSGNDPGRPSSWKTDKAQAGSGALGDLLSHLVDIALYLNGPILETAGHLQTFKESRDIDDATLALARFANGSIGSFEASRYAVGFRNRNAFEIHGERGMLRFNLEDLNRLEFHDATEAGSLQGARSLLVTGPDHPYWTNFWKPGHIVGYEHTFIAALADFLQALHSESAFHPNFEDAQQVQLVLGAIEQASKSRCWTTVNLT